MKTASYIGFNNDICTCGYVFDTINGVPCLVLKQMPGSKTAITLLVEDIVNQLLRGDLLGVDATKMRVFEFYPPSINPLVNWQEVTFKVAKREPRKTIVESIVEFFKPMEQPYVVWNPSWNPIGGPLQQKLSALDPALV
jgi:hypothetical protein